MRFFVAGGAGYVGSHFVNLASELGHKCYVYDNLSLGHRESIPKQCELIVGDILDCDKLTNLLKHIKPDAVLHYAAYALVGESVSQPSRYYKINVEGTRCLLDAVVRQQSMPSFIFSSSCAIFGSPENLPVDESSPKRPNSPYGFTKLVCEHMIEDFCRAHGLKASALRYFNAAGAAINGKIGEKHSPETHLIPNLIRATLEGEGVSIFGKDYDTRDGTCIRDYIHVTDLAHAHLLAAEYLKTQSPGHFEPFNLGSGDGYTNLEVNQEVQRALNKSVDIKFEPRRAGDATALYANPSKAKSLLSFQTKYSDLPTIVKTASAWHKGGETFPAS